MFLIYFTIDNLLSGWLDDYWQAIGLDDFVKERYEKIGGMYTNAFIRRITSAES